MIAKFMTALFSLMIFCMIGCGEDSSSILKPETQPAVSPAVFEDVPISDDAPAAPPMCLPKPLMCMVPPQPVDLEWHELTQTQRNRKIIDRAYEDLKVEVGRSCKEWVYDVVLSASGGKVKLPWNDPDAKDRWLDSEFTEGRTTSITTAKPGEIVQIRWKKGIGDPHNLHTLIVVSVGPNDITFIDSNWHGDEMVDDQTRSISIFEGDNAWAKSFTIYTIK